MSNAEGCITIDTNIIVPLTNLSNEIRTDYDRLIINYKKIITDLLGEWKGKGKDEFEKDAIKIQDQIKGIYSILTYFLDRYRECCVIITEADAANADSNAEAFARKGKWDPGTFSNVADKIKDTLPKI